MELPLVQDKLAPQSISLGSDAWFTWLAQNKSFRYRPSSEGYNYPRSDITVRNRTKDYWYAYRKVNAVQRTYYLGKTKDLDFEKLQQAVDELSLSDSQYQKLISDRRAGVHIKFVQPTAGEEELLKLQEKYNLLQIENEKLKAELIIAMEIVQEAKGIADRVAAKNMIRGKDSLFDYKDRIESLINKLG